MTSFFEIGWFLFNAVIFPVITVCFFNSVLTPRIKGVYIHIIYVVFSSVATYLIMYELMPKAPHLIMCNAFQIAVAIFCYKDKISKKLIDILVYFLVLNTFDVMCSFLITMVKIFDDSQMRLISSAVAAITVALGLYFTSKYINNRKIDALGKRGFVFLVIPLSHLLMVFGFGMIVAYYEPYYKDVFANISKIEAIASITIFLTLVFALVADIIAFDQYVKNLNTAKIEARNESLERINDLNTQYFESLRDKEDELRKIKHDIGGSLETVKELLYEQKDIQKAEEFFDELSEYVSSLNTGFYSGNSLVNAIIIQKEKICSQNDIEFDVSVSLPSEVLISDTDLCRSLVNILDNAIEAVQKNHLEKTISINISTIDDYIYIKVENSYDGQSVDTATKKVNKEDHGFGLKILKDIAEKYDGSFSIENSNVVTALLVLKNAQL